MIGREVRVWATDNLELLEPIHADCIQHSSGGEVLRAEVNIVDDAFEVMGVVAVHHLTLAVGVVKLKLVHQLWLAQRGPHPGPHGGTEASQEPLVAMVP